jgi:hypothetical protein
MPYDYSYDHVAPPAPIPRKEKGWFANSSALQKKRMFWIIALVVLAVLAIAIGVGVGVGVSQSNASKGGDSDRYVPIYEIEIAATWDRETRQLLLTKV